MHGITRRDFLRFSAAALGSLWLTSVLPAPLARGQDSDYGTPTYTPQFNPLPAPSLLAAPADVAIGADGVTWVTGTDGAPSTYDPVSATWTPYGSGIDAAAYVAYRDNNGNYQLTKGYFRGGQLFQAGDQGPVAITDRWPGPPALPASFQGGVDGAANFGNTGTAIFRQGRAAFVLAGGEFGSVQSLAGFSGWPGDAWTGGNFDYVISGWWEEGLPNYVYFVLGSDYITVELFSMTVVGPAPLAGFYAGAALALLAETGSQPGNQAVLVDGLITDPTAPLSVFRGPAVYRLENATSTTPAQVTYIAQQDPHWPAAWHPVLKQAPAGRVGNLWGLTAAGTPLTNDGSSWTPVPLGSGTPAVGLDVGTDGTVFAIGAEANGSVLYRLDASGSSWTAAATTAVALADLSVGDSSYVWVRDGQGAVYRFDGSSGSFTQANLGVTATDINADPDGTLWHCSAGQGSVYRYLAGGSQVSESISIGQGVTGVQKAASSSFGTGLFLAQQNGQPALVQYTSPYVFKTASSYFVGSFPTIAVGVSSIFLTLPDTVNTFRVVALDAETGAERWSNTYFDPSDGALSPIYDAHHHLVYAFSTMGAVVAFDAHSGQQIWTVGLASVLPVAPVLSGGLLLLSGTDSLIEYPNSQKVYLTAIDTLAAVQAAANQQPVQSRWLFTIDATGQQPEPTPPVVSNGGVYCGVWSQVGTPVLDVLRVDAATGAGAQLYGDMDEFGTVYNQVSEIAPLMAPVKMPTGQTVPALVLAGPDGLYALQLDGSGEYAKYTNGLGANNMIWSNLAYFAGVIYVGDQTGNVHAVDGSFAPAPGSPYRFTNSNAPLTLAVAPDANGAAILLAIDETAQLALYFTDGDISSTLATNQTQIGTMSAVTPEGMIYMGGASDAVSSSNLGQIFGVRTNDLRDLRDFVVESQLLQDYDPGAVAVARYQTHVTIVDNNKVPRPLVDVKLWADETLDVIVAGQPYTIGPAAPLSTQVDASGTLTILSDATDLFAIPLRLWAAFMDPSERIVIYPDQEFHARLPNMTADPNDDDPNTINLATGTNYAGTKIFTDQAQAQAVANAVKTASSGLGLGGGAATLLAPAPVIVPSAPPTCTQNPVSVAAATQPFVAYADLPGVRYFAANTPATRQPVPQGTLGLALNLNGADEFTVMGFAEAAAAIDGLQGEPDSRLLGLPPGSWFSGIWDDFKSGVAAIEQIVVSVADLIYIGIRYVINKVVHVVRAVVHDIEDVVSLIGAIFIKLGKLIKDVIELLSLLLHFEEIIATYKLLQPALLGQVQALATIIPNQLQKSVADFFEAGEQTILDAFCTVKQQIDSTYVCSSTSNAPAGSEMVSGFCGIGATPHTIFTVAPKSGGAASSHAVHATWGLHKVKDHYKGATTATAPAPGSDPLTDFFTTFAASLSSNPQLKAAFASTQSDFAATFQVRSSTEFLQMAIIDLLDVMQLLVVDGLGIAQALLSGLLKLGQDLVDYLVGSESGLLMRTLDIPILSDLFKLLTGDDLTFFNLIVLVAAIPITIVYRVIEGAWPADQVDAAAATAPVLARLFGILEVACYVGNAIFAAISDMFIVEGESPPVVAIILVGLGIGSVIPPLYSIADSAEGVNLAAQIAQIAVGGLGDLGGSAQFSEAAPVLLTVCALTAISTAIVEKVKNDINWTGFSGDILGEIPPFVRPLQYLAKQFPFATTITLASIDMGVNFATALADFIGLVQSWDTLPDIPTALPPGEEPGVGLPGRSYLPVIGAP